MQASCRDFPPSSLLPKSYGLQWLCHLTPTHDGYRRWRSSASEVCRCELGFTFASYGCTGTRQAAVGCHLQVNCCDEIQFCANCWKIMVSGNSSSTKTFCILVGL